MQFFKVFIFVYSATITKQTINSETNKDANTNKSQHNFGLSYKFFSISTIQDRNFGKTYTIEDIPKNIYSSLTVDIIISPKENNEKISFIESTTIFPYLLFIYFKHSSWRFINNYQ